MHRTTYQQADVDGVSVFYREAGPPDKPVILLLHGFPSSRQWEPLLTRLADEFHLVAPDYPGFGHSDAPDPAGFAYTFDHLAEITGRFTEQLGLDRYTLFVQDYGGPVGFRLATAHPERVRAIIVQNAVAHEDYMDRTAASVNPADIAAMAEANVRLMVAGPDRDPAELDPAVWELALEMCRGVYAREWNGPLFTERHLQPPARGRLAQIRVPTLVINGLADVPGIQEISALLADGISGAGRLDLAATGHLPPMERPVEVTGALGELFAQV